MSPDYPFDDAATARAVIADDGTLTGWNAGAQRLLGWTAADVVGRPATRLLADPDGVSPGHGVARLGGSLFRSPIG